MINLNIYLLNGFIFLSYDFVDKKILIEMSRSKRVFFFYDSHANKYRSFYDQASSQVQINGKE